MPTERQEANLDDLDLEGLADRFAAIELEAKPLKTKIEALDKEKRDVQARIVAKVQALEVDAADAGGYSWEPKSEPKATVSDTRALVNYLAENGMTDYLTVLPSKVQSVIDEEAENNTLDIQVVEEVVDGKTIERTIFKSAKLPYTNVFQHTKLGRTKSKKTGGRLKNVSVNAS